MEIKDIKVGETYNVRVRVDKKLSSIFETRTLSPNGEIMDVVLFNNREAAAFTPATNNFKYDPWRQFKKGDIVRVVEWYGRSLQDVPTDYNLWEVLTDENGECVRIMLCHKMERIRKVVAACFLELVTPVEEREPYRVEKCLSRYIVYYHDPDEDGMTGRVYEQSAFYFGPSKQYTEDEALAAAEAECDRLNKKYRKEQR